MILEAEKAWDVPSIKPPHILDYMRLRVFVDALTIQQKYTLTLLKKCDQNKGGK